MEGLKKCTFPICIQLYQSGLTEPVKSLSIREIFYLKQDKTGRVREKLTAALHKS
jgi:hypothetical protein